MADVSIENRFLNLAEINLGEALAELGNVRQRGGTPGADCGNVKIALHRALAALDGQLYSPPPDVKNF